MNFKKYYICGDRFTFNFRFEGDWYWNTLMYRLTVWTTKKPKPTIKPGEQVTEETMKLTTEKVVKKRKMKERPDTKE